MKNIVRLLLLLTLFVPGLVFAQYGLDTTAGAAGLNKGLGATGDISSFIGTLIGTGLSFIGIVFFILMLYGGFLWMTARGNEDQTGKAIGTITAGAIGMVIIMASYAITSFLFTSLTPATNNGSSGANFSTGVGEECPSGFTGTCIEQGGQCPGSLLGSQSCSGNQYLCCVPQVAGNALCCVADSTVIGIVSTIAECESRCNPGSGFTTCTANNVPASDCTPN